MGCNCLSSVGAITLKYHNGTTYTGLVAGTPTTIPVGVFRWQFGVTYHCNSDNICTCNATVAILLGESTATGVFAYYYPACFTYNNMCFNQDVTKTQDFTLPATRAGHSYGLRVEVYDGLTTLCPVSVTGVTTPIKDQDYSYGS